MKLFATGVVLYVVQLFLLPLGADMVRQYAPAGLLDDAHIETTLLYILPMAILAAIGAYIYARWARSPLKVGNCIAIGFVFLLMPAFAYMFQLGIAFYENPLIAVEGLQEVVVPLFESFEGGDGRLFVQAIAFVPYVAPFLLGPCIASFFAKERAVAEARIVL